MAFTFIDEGGPQETASRFRFVDEVPAQSSPQQVKPKGILENATDVFTGAGASMAQGVNESLGSINKSFGLDSTVYDQGADYWKNTADEAGSTGLPAQIYQGIGAAPAGVAEFIAGSGYAAAKGAVQGYQEGGVPGALEKATIEGVKRLGIGKVFHGIENTAVSGMTKAGAMGSTMGAQTAAEQAMTDEGIKPQDVAASAITGTLLSVGGGGRSEAIRQNLIKEGVQPEIARDLAGRAEEVPAGNSANPSRFRFVDEVAPKEPTKTPITITDPQGQPLDTPIDTRPPESIGPLVSETGNGNVLSLGEISAPTRYRFIDQTVTDPPANTPALQTEVESNATTAPLNQETNPINAAAHEAATSPWNNLPEPTQAQIDAGNYKKGHVTLHGLDIAIENPQGSIRKGVDETGREWETELAHHYGYFKGTVGKDRDPVDVFIGPDHESNKVYVIDQKNTKTGSFDEHKTLLGFNSPEEARAGYLANYDESGPQRIGAITEAPVEVFKKWLNEGNTKKPFTEFSAKETSATETARQSAAETLNSVYPESSPDIGLAVKPAVKRNDNVVIPDQHIDKSGNFTFADPQVEGRWKSSNGLADGPSLLERTKSFLHRMLSETRHFPELDDSNYAGKRTADILRRFESSAVAAKAKTAEHLHGLTATFGPKKMDIFTRKVILDDLMNEADKGRGLPFGYTPETLQNDHAAVSKIVTTNPDIAAAVKRRADVNKALVMDLVDNDLLPVESVLKPEALDRFQKTGKYSSDDINTAYFRHQVLEYANAKRWAGISTAGDVRNKQRGWQKGREGSEKDINTNFLEAEFEVFSQGLKELATKKTLDEVLTLNNLVPELKAQAQKEGTKDWKDLIPEEYAIWQPVQGSIFYRGQSLPEQIVTKFLAENPHFADIAKKFKEVTIRGGRKTEVVIPKGLAKTLDSLRTDRESTTLDTVNQKILGAWKIWTLLSPRRAIKYNLNNMSGDLDAAVAADPAIVVKHFNTAWKNGWSRKAGRAMTKDEIDMLDRGVIDSGISINEIPDINKLPGFSRLSESERQEKMITALRSGDLSKLAPPNVISKYFYWVSGLSQLREGLLREAAYLRAKELLEQGKKVYWASKPAEIDALPDVRDKAAKLSRELLGDYGNLSAHGEKIRARFIPFWSWMEINSPRYYRLFKNAAAKGEGGSTAARMAGVGTRKIAGATLGMAEKVLLTQVLFASVTAFNHLVHPDEEELLSESDQKQLHVILGSKANGNVMTVRFQGAFSDALSWFGLEDYPETLRKLKAGEMESGELAKKMLSATPNKIANAAAPFFKLSGELITGKSIYPDITKPVPIRDKIEHAARFLSLDNEYKALGGKPSHGYLNSLKDLYLYESDPGEAAYNNIRRIAAKYLEKNGKEAVSGEPTKRSNALYYYKQALRYDDEEAADKYKEEYFADGGTREGIQKSIAKAHPMWMLPLNQRAKFRQSLSAQELETLTKGIEWYRQVYTP